MNQAALFASSSLTPAMKARDYQDEAFPAVMDWLSRYGTWPLVVIPTGGGKSLVMAELMRRCFEIEKDTRFVVLSHVGELQVQNAEAFAGQCPGVPFSFYSDKLGQKDLSGQVIFATIQSVHKKAYQIQTPPPDIILIDEVHLLPHTGEGMYRKFLADVMKINPQVKCIGYSATPFRAKTGLLHKGEGALFGGIAYEVNVLDLINQGYLAPISTPTMSMRMDVTGVKIQGGDYVAKQLEKAVDIDEVTKGCVNEIIQHSEGRNKWLVFTAGVSHCKHVRDEIRSRGIACEMVTGATPTEERNRIVAWHKERSREPRCLVNVTVFTVGFNNPAIDLIAFMRPTRSPVLYIQMIGRAMRIFPGKEDAVILDFCSIIETLGPIDQIRLPQRKKGSGDAPSKICPECAEENHAAARICIKCGWQFPPPQIKIGNNASDAAVLSTQLMSKPYPVTGMNFYRHKKDGRADTLRVEYQSGIMNVYKRWLSFEGTGGAREFACFWWRKMAGTVPPKTIAEALERASEIKRPHTVHIKKVGKYFEITGEDL